MTFFYYEINTRRFIQSTNIRALEEFSGLSYHKIWNWFNNGSNIHVDDSIICGCSDLVRGKQRIIIKETPISPTGPTGPTGPGPCPAGDTGPQEEKIDLNKRTTEQPDNRNMSKFDDFFNEVK
jgi:hypothetical protein